jgi:hypothetical protein
MIRIPVQICGDIWVNPEEVVASLNTDEDIRLDFQAEGPSITALGIVDEIKRTGINPERITIINNPNTQEKTPYRNTTPPTSHFFLFSSQYWTDIPPTQSDAKLFGYFMGRRTFSRVRILYDLWKRSDTMLSLMNSVLPPPWIFISQGRNLEQIDDWLDIDMRQWFENCPVTSVDGRAVRDQYVENAQTNHSILTFYNQFHVELVAETFTIGDTFFPTEKTVRPLMAGKPFIVYGPRHFLKNLRNLGFKTYSTCWDESYDELEGPARWQAIQQVLNTVQISNKEIEIAQYNRKHLEQGITKW